MESETKTAKEESSWAGLAPTQPRGAFWKPKSLTLLQRSLWCLLLKTNFVFSPFVPSQWAFDQGQGFCLSLDSVHVWAEGQVTQETMQPLETPRDHTESSDITPNLPSLGLSQPSPWVSKGLFILFSGKEPKRIPNCTQISVSPWELCSVLMETLTTVMG